jgi:tetratricopeptide (TPR) repeat protein
MERGKEYMLSIALNKSVATGTGSYIINEATSVVRDDIIENIPFIELLPRQNPKGLIYHINEIDEYPLEESGYEKEPTSEKLLIALVGALWLFIIAIFRFQWHIIIMGKLINKHAIAVLIPSIGLIVAGIFVMYYNTNGIFSVYLLSTLLLSVGTSGWDPSNGSNKNGIEKLESKDYKGAVSDFSEAVKIAPYAANFRNNRGLAYCGLQRWEEAVTDFAAAWQLSPNNVTYKKNLADAQEQFKKSGGGGDSYDFISQPDKRIIKTTIVIMVIEVIALSIVGHAIRPRYHEMTLFTGMTEEDNSHTDLNLYDDKAIAEVDNLAEASRWIRRNASKGSNYTIVLGADQSVESLSFGYGGKEVTVTLTSAGGEKTITRNGSLHPVIVIKGKETTFTLEDGIILSGTGEVNDDAESLVKVSRGTFVMNGGIITAGEDGGVYVDKKGSFIMNGGVITGNHAYAGGGVDSSGMFTMSGGAISGNTAGYQGGGVYYSNSTFTMTGGVISGNISGSAGGGVYGFIRKSGGFFKSGGIIYGSNAKEALANKVQNPRGDPPGDAVHLLHESARKLGHDNGFDKTVDEQTELSSNDYSNWEWDYGW